MIHARDLRYAYPNGVAALDGVDLSVAPGERVADRRPERRRQDDAHAPAQRAAAGAAAS